MTCEHVIEKQMIKDKNEIEVAYDNERKTSFGIMKTHISYTITPLNIDTFMEKGIIKCIDVEEKEDDNIGYYIETLSKAMGCSPDELADWLDKLNKVCPKAVLDVLESAIANHFLDLKAYKSADKLYGIRLSDGKVGVVASNSMYIPKFSSIEAAEKARDILKDQLELMYGK